MVPTYESYKNIQSLSEISVKDSWAFWMKIQTWMTFEKSAFQDVDFWLSALNITSDDNEINENLVNNLPLYLQFPLR